MKKKIKFFLISAILIFYFLALLFSQKNIEDFFYAYISEPLQNIPELKIGKKEPEVEIEAKTALILRIGKRERILFQKNIDEILPIASLTKLMTALIVFENYDLSDSIKISKEAANQGNVSDLQGNLKEGEVFKIEELLDLMLIYSSNDAAYALAEKMGIENFIEKMKKKAKEIGLEKTNFFNPTGLDPKNSTKLNHSTAKDLAKLAKYILEKEPRIFEITLKNRSLNFYLENGKAIGGKTGYTEKAKGSIIFLFKNEKENIFINICLGIESEEKRVEEMQKLINWINFSKEDFKLSLVKWEKIDAPWQARDSHTTIVFKDKIWLMGGLNGKGCVEKLGLVKYEDAPHFSDIWNSKDGKNWNLINKEAPWGKKRSMQAAIFKNKIWLIGGWGPEIGYSNEIWVSENGIDWEKIIPKGLPAVEGHQLVVFKDKLWLIGGVNYEEREEKNFVFSSEDGINWNKISSFAPWSPRWDHSVLVFKEKLWLSGGMDLKGNNFGDLWVSEDGENWNLVFKNQAWSERQGHCMISFKDRIWIFGSLDSNDIWFSEDGYLWKKISTLPPWTAREDYSCAVFKDKIWIIGGMDANWNWKNDVWYSIFP